MKDKSIINKNGKRYLLFGDKAFELIDEIKKGELPRIKCDVIKTKKKGKDRVIVRPIFLKIRTKLLKINK